MHIYSQLISKEEVLTFRKWSFKIKVISVKQGLAFGLTGEENKFKQSSCYESFTLAYCSRTSSIYINGRKTTKRGIELTAGTAVGLIVDQERRVVRFIRNNDIF